MDPTGRTTIPPFLLLGGERHCSWKGEIAPLQVVAAEATTTGMFFMLRWREDAGNKSARGQVFINVEAPRRKSLMRKGHVQTDMAGGRGGIVAVQPHGLNG
jgi:hypothetical protein